MSSWFNPKTEKRASPIHGRGLFARVAIPAGEVVAVKGGAIMDRSAFALARDQVSPAEILDRGSSVHCAPFGRRDRSEHTLPQSLVRSERWRSRADHIRDYPRRSSRWRAKHRLRDDRR